LRAVQLLLGHTKLESTVRYLGIEVDDLACHIRAGRAVSRDDTRPGRDRAAASPRDYSPNYKR
jgi:hypothetical protein